MSYKKQKLELVQESMRTNNIECTVIPLGINFRWLFEFFGEQSDRFIVAIIYQEGAPILITPEYEKAALCNATGITDSIGWYEEENPITSLTEKISHINGSIALDPQMWFSSFYHISYKLPKKEYISAETIFNSLRAVKDNDEQEYLTKASQQTANAIIETLYELKIGITEGEVLKILKDKFNRISSSPNYTEVSFGENTAILPCFSTIKKLQKNDVVVIDAGLTINDYWGDITITSVFGKATSNFKNIYNIVKKANSLAKDVAALNTRACDVDKAARDYITKKDMNNILLTELVMV